MINITLAKISNGIAIIIIMARFICWVTDKFTRIEEEEVADVLRYY